MKSLKNPHKDLSFFIQRIPGYILWIFSFFMIRSKTKWAFGSQTGYLGSNPFYLMLDIMNQHPEIKVAWLCEDCKSFNFLSQRNIPVYKKWSIRGVLYCLTAKVYVYSHGVGDVNFSTSGNTFKINLWHGISYKKIEYMAQLKWINKTNPFHRIVYPFFCVNHNLILSSSAYISQWLRDCFRCSENVMLYNYPPRCQTRNWNFNRIYDFASKFNPCLIPLIELAKKHNKSFFYMPTYRDKSSCSVLETSNFDLEKTNDVLKANNDIMFVKFHPRDLAKIKEFPVLSNIIVVKDNIDPYLFFPYISVLITDYSSVYPEYMLYNDQIVIFDFDKEQYEKEENGCYYNIDDFISAIHAHSFDDLLEIVKNKSDCSIPNRDEMFCKLWGKCENEDIFNQIISRLNNNA